MRSQTLFCVLWSKKMTKSPQELLADAISESLTEKKFNDLDKQCQDYIRSLVDLIYAKFCQKLSNQK